MISRYFSITSLKRSSHPRSVRKSIPVQDQSYTYSQSWRIRLHSLPALVAFFHQNLLSVSQDGILKVMDILLDCLSHENVEVREMASKAISGVVRCAQRQSVIPLRVLNYCGRFNGSSVTDIRCFFWQDRFIAQARKISLPSRRDSTYAESLKKLHSAILGLCALMETTPYSVEPWLPPLTESILIFYYSFH